MPPREEQRQQRSAETASLRGALFFLVITGAAFIAFLPYARTFIHATREISFYQGIARLRARIIGIVQQHRQQPPALYPASGMKLEAVEFKKDTSEEAALIYASGTERKKFAGRFITEKSGGSAGAFHRAFKQHYVWRDNVWKLSPIVNLTDLQGTIPALLDIEAPFGNSYYFEIFIDQSRRLTLELTLFLILAEYTEEHNAWRLARGKPEGLGAVDRFVWDEEFLTWQRDP